MVAQWLKHNSKSQLRLMPKPPCASIPNWISRIPPKWQIMTALHFWYADG
jgi:hypothetical protein